MKSTFCTFGLLSFVACAIAALYSTPRAFSQSGDQSITLDNVQFTLRAVPGDTRVSYLVDGDELAGVTSSRIAAYVEDGELRAFRLSGSPKQARANPKLTRNVLAALSRLTATVSREGTPRLYAASRTQSDYLAAVLFNAVFFDGSLQVSRRPASSRAFPLFNSSAGKVTPEHLSRHAERLAGRRRGEGSNNTSGGPGHGSLPGASGSTPASSIPASSTPASSAPANPTPATSTPLPKTVTLADGTVVFLPILPAESAVA